MTGHVFVVQGNALQIACDELLVPTDENGTVSAAWDELNPPVLPRGWKAGTPRVSDAVIRDRHRVRWVNTGSLPEVAAQQRGWLQDGVHAAMTASAQGLQTSSPQHGRTRPLIAAPIFGTGAGGFSGMRGAVIKDLLATAQQVVETHDVDIVLVANARSDFAALQAERLWSGQFDLSPGLQEKADELGQQMARGEVAFFIGAGMSLPAGLPTWSTLIQRLGQQSEKYRESVQELLGVPAPDAAQLLSEEKGFRERLAEQLRSPFHALGHSLIASMRPAEVITTNFDTLYEQAAASTYTQELVVIPSHRGTSRAPWLLKLHGDINGPRIVLNRDEFLGYDTVWRPLAGMLQATMLTRHLVFVGYSLDDENFIRLGRSVGALLREMKYEKPVGTLVTPVSKPLRTELWGKDLTEVATVMEGQNELRTFEVFLDRMAMAATSGESSWLLDEAYSDLLSDADRELAATLRAAGRRLPRNASSLSRWGVLEDAFEALGLQRPSE